MHNDGVNGDVAQKAIDLIISFIRMFEWLTEEMTSVKTRKFYLVDGLLPEATRQAIEDAQVPVPPTYKAFVLQFGNAQLYRHGSIYMVQVYAAPRDVESDEGERLLHFARTPVALAYFKESLLVPNNESPVYEWRHQQGLRLAADGFEEWLIKRCKAARQRFKQKDWQAIKNGPQPFTAYEKAIIKARQQFTWRYVGIAKNRDILIEVHNGSHMILPYLSIGVKLKKGADIGGIWLPVDSVKPGEIRILQKDCYKEHNAPEEIALFNQPDPEPEDRNQYWEFKDIAGVTH